MAPLLSPGKLGALWDFGPWNPEPSEVHTDRCLPSALSPAGSSSLLPGGKPVLGLGPQSGVVVISPVSAAHPPLLADLEGGGTSTPSGLVLYQPVVSLEGPFPSKLASLTMA